MDHAGSENIHRYSMKAVATTCWIVKVASASMARISSGDCCGGATVSVVRQLWCAVMKLSTQIADGREADTYILQTLWTVVMDWRLEKVG